MPDFNLDFAAASAFPRPPAPSEYHVWKAGLELNEDLRERLRAYLSPDESERAAKFVFDRDRFAYIAGRGMLRVLLGAYLDRPPASLRFAYNREGRPRLAGEAAADFHFNLSHSGGGAAYVFSRLERCGIDIEFPRDNVDVHGIASFFTENENRALRNTPPEYLTDEFLRFWTGKEAVLKAIGQGLSLELSSLEIATRAESLETVLVQNSREEGAAWQLYELRPWPTSRCTLAYRGGPADRIDTFELDEELLRARINET